MSWVPVFAEEAYWTNNQGNAVYQRQISTNLYNQKKNTHMAKWLFPKLENNNNNNNNNIAPPEGSIFTHKDLHGDQISMF